MISDVGFNPSQLYVQSRNDHFLLINVNYYICNLTFILHAGLTFWIFALMDQKRS
jgi:hypothetical protein